MTAASTCDNLTADALYIQKTARSLDELRTWLGKHLEVLSYGYTIPDDAEVELKLNASWNGLLSYVAQTNILLVFVDTKVYAQHAPHPAMRGILDVSTSGRIALFSHAATLSLQLADWPLATMIVAAEYLYSNLDEHDEKAKKELRIELETFIAKHFPGKSLAHLEAFHEAGLFDNPSGNQLDLEMMADILFSSSHPVMSQILPDMAL